MNTERLYPLPLLHRPQEDLPPQFLPTGVSFSPSSNKISILNSHFLSDTPFSPFSSLEISDPFLGKGAECVGRRIRERGKVGGDTWPVTPLIQR